MAEHICSFNWNKWLKEIIVVLKIMHATLQTKVDSSLLQKNIWNSHSFSVTDNVAFSFLEGWSWSWWRGSTVMLMRVLASDEWPRARNTMESWVASEPSCLYRRRDCLIVLWSRLSSEGINNTNMRKQYKLCKYWFCCIFTGILIFFKLSNLAGKKVNFWRTNNHLL